MLTPKERALKRARFVAWSTTYLVASQVLVLSIGLTTGKWIFSDPKTSAASSLISAFVIMLLWMAATWWSWSRQPRWLAILVTLDMVGEDAFKLYLTTVMQQPLHYISLLPFIVTVYCVIGLVGTFQLAKLRRTVGPIPS